MNMQKTTVVYGLILVVLGIIGYIATGAASVTALIPSFFGIIIVGLGLWARSEKHRGLAMHIAAGLALIGFIATVTGFGKVAALLSGGEVARPAAAISQSIMALLSGGYLGAAITSFVTARKQRKLSEGTPSTGESS